jgi:hypothetical protein
MTSSASSPPTDCLVVRRRLSGFGTAGGQGGGSATPPDARPGGHRDRCGVRGSRGAPAAAAGHLEGNLPPTEGKRAGRCRWPHLALPLASRAILLPHLSRERKEMMLSSDLTSRPFRENGDHFISPLASRPFSHPLQSERRCRHDIICLLATHILQLVVRRQIWDRRRRPRRPKRPRRRRSNAAGCSA